MSIGLKFLSLVLLLFLLIAQHATAENNSTSSYSNGEYQINNLSIKESDNALTIECGKNRKVIEQGVGSFCFISNTYAPKFRRFDWIPVTQKDLDRIGTTTIEGRPVPTDNIFEFGQNSVVSQNLFSFFSEEKTTIGILYGSAGNRGGSATLFLIDTISGENIEVDYSEPDKPFLSRAGDWPPSGGPTRSQSDNKVNDFFASRVLDGSFIGTKNFPQYVEIQLEGENLYTAYAGIDYETISNWQDEDSLNGTHRPVQIRYSLEDGVLVTDITTGKKYRLIGEMKKHPIDMLIKKCLSGAGHRQMTYCAEIAYVAWDAELNRAYKLLGGSTNVKLTLMQRAWIKYKEELGLFLSEHYNRGGEVWGLRYAGHLTNATREQAKLLQSFINE